MAITVRIPTVLRKHTDGAKTVEGQGDTLGALLDDISSRHGGLKPAITDEQGNLARFINVYVNDEDVRFLDGLDTKLSDGDSVAILPAVAGGA